MSPSYETAAGITPELLRKVRALPPGRALLRERGRGGRWIERVVPRRSFPAPPPPKTASPAPAPAGARAPRGGVGYVEVARERVPYALVRAVEAELPRLCRVLGVAVPRLTFFRRALQGETPDFIDEPVLGVSWPAAGLVALSKDLTPRRGVEILGHELMHLRTDATEADCHRAESVVWTSLGRLS